MRQRVLVFFVLAVAAGQALARQDTSAVIPRMLHGSDLTGRGQYVPGQGRLPGVGLWDKASAVRCFAGDDSTFAARDFDDRPWAKPRHEDSLVALNAPVYWLRYHFELDPSIGNPALILNIAAGGQVEVWLDGEPVAHMDLPGRDLSADIRGVPDTAALISFSLVVEDGNRPHVLAFRMVSGMTAFSWKDLRASLHSVTSTARMHRSSMHGAVFVGVNVFILLMALLFWKMDRHDRVWPWFAALTGTNAFISFSELARTTELGFSTATVSFLEHVGDALMLVPFCLAVLLLLVILGQANGRTWWMYVISGILISSLAPVMVYVTLGSEGPNTIGSLVLFLSLGALALLSGGWFMVEIIRLGIRVVRSKGFQRWIGAGIFVGSLVPILVPVVWLLVMQFVFDRKNIPVPEGVKTLADYVGYIALPLSVIISLAIRSNHQNRMLARQRDDLDKEVHERTAELREERDRSETLLLNILPLEVAKELKEKGAAEARHFDQASVLFSDFKGFTEMSGSVAPGELLQELNACFHAFDDIIGARGIEKIKTIGDAYMCAGGLPDPKNSSPLDVVFAALEMQEFLQARKLERERAGLFAFDMRLGIHSGPVVAGIVGVKKFQYDIWGDTVNMASRMETSGEVGRVNISAGTYALVKEVPGLRFAHRGQVTVKGKGATEMWFVERA